MPDSRRPAPARAARARVAVTLLAILALGGAALARPDAPATPTQPDSAAAASGHVAPPAAGTPSAPAPTAGPPPGAAARLPGHTARKRPGRAADTRSVLVRFNGGVATATRRATVARSGGRLGATIGPAGLTRVEVTGDPSTAVARLRTDPAVAGVSLNYRRQLHHVPNDPRYAGTQAADLGALRLPAAWDVEAAAADQIVAVVDTGVDGTHPDLVGRLVPGCNTVGPTAGCHGSTADANPSTYDGAGHGTMVAGIIGASTDNNIGIAGVTNAAKIMPIKVFGPDPDDPSLLTATDDDVIQGVYWAADHGATVINLSLGGESPGALEAAMTYARGKGAVVIAAAGNSGAEVPEYPGAFASVIAVAATDSAGRLTEFSTRGDWVDVAAPGFEVASTFPGGAYQAWSGTSFSAPLVAGVAALARTAGGLDGDATVARLTSTARDAGPRGLDPFFGHGLVDAAAAVGVPALPPGPGVAEVLQPDMIGDGNGFPARATAFASSTVAGTIGIEGDVDWYRRSIGAARRITLTVTPPPYLVTSASNMDPVLRVYDQNLRLLAWADNLFDATATETATLTTPAGTTALYIAVHSYHGGQDARSYRLTARAPRSARTPRRGAAMWVRDVTPVPYAVGQATGVTPTVTFAQPMLAASVNSSTVRLRDGRTGALVAQTTSYSATTRTATLRPAAPLSPTGAYRVEVGAVRNTAGTSHPGRVTSTFRVGVTPVSGLTVTATPDGDTTDVALNWTNPPIGNLDKVVVRYAAGVRPPATPTAGTAAYDSDDPAYPSDTDANVEDLTGVANTFSIFSLDDTGLYSAPVVFRVSKATVTLAAPTAAVYGAPIRLTGVIRHAGGLPLPAAAAQLEFVPAGGGAPTPLATLTSNAAGVVTYQDRPLVRGTYHLRYLGTGGTSPVFGASGSRTVGIRVSVAAGLNRSTTRRGVAVALAGRVGPNLAGRSVTLQRWTGRSWRNAGARVLSAASRYSFGIRPGGRGRHVFRVYQPGDADHLGAVSATRTVTVK